MIKKFLYSLTALSLVLFTASCEDVNGDNFGADIESGYVQFVDDNAVTAVAPFQSTIEIPVDLHTNVNASGLEVTYVIENVVGDASQILESTSGIVTFAKGELTSNIVLNISTTNAVGSYQFNVVLDSANRPNVQIGAAESTPTVKSVCISTIAPGTYNGVVYYLDSPEGTPDLIGPFTTELTATATEGVYNLSSGWGLFVPALTGNPAHSTYTNPLELDFNNSTNGSIVVNSLVSYGSEGDTGSVGCGGTISYIIGENLFQNPVYAYVVLTPAN